MDSIEVGNVVRYVGAKPYGWLQRGGIAKVIQTSKGGKVRLSAKGGSPQWVDASRCEIVSPGEDGGIFGAAGKPKQTAEQPAPEPDPQPAAEEKPAPEEQPEPATDPSPYGPDPALWVQVMAMWPKYEDGSPVMLGDFVQGDDITDQVTLISFDKDGYELGCYSISIENRSGETVERGQDSMELICDAARDAINAGRMTIEVFGELAARARRLGDAQ